MYKIQNIIEKMYLKNYMVALMTNEDIRLEGYHWKFNALKSQLVMIGMPMVKEYFDGDFVECFAWFVWVFHPSNCWYMHHLIIWNICGEIFAPQHSIIKGCFVYTL
jgi:hypothetical protein